MKVTDEPEMVAALRLAAASEESAVPFMEARRWGDSPSCPRCGAANVYRMVGGDGGRERHYRWRCRSCKRQYSVRTGTVMEESRLPVRVWVHAFWRACASKKGVSALQLQRECGINYKSALFVLNRIRHGMSDFTDPETPKLTGTVEADETFVGGRRRMYEPSRIKDRSGHYQPVVGMVERGGGLRLVPVRNVGGGTLRAALVENIDAASRLITDEWSGYRALGKAFERGHHTVDHKHKEMKRGDIYTNTVESAFSLLKRGLNGTYHHVSKRHLFRYCDEFGFRFSNRFVTDGVRVEIALRKSQGKRLTRADVAATPVPFPPPSGPEASEGNAPRP